jgi:5-oxoprolinase (ATP-hydrolysing) subunit A
MSERVVDLNADVGEGEDAADVEIMRVVTSVSIACGFHAGDPSTMRRTVDLALESGVAIGAHPGLDDREGFGRRARPLAPGEAYEIVLYQTGALDACVRAAGARLAHVKTHGALYNMAARDAALADAIASAVADYDDRLILFGLAGSELVRAAKIRGLPVASEVFADRRYGADGFLLDRENAGAFVTDATLSARRVLEMLDGRLPAAEAPGIAVAADTVCLHGDTPGAAAFARSLREALEGAGVRLRSVGATE